MQAASSIARRGNKLTSGRKFSSDELRLMVLCFLRESPAHGYDLIKRFDELSHRYYSPSPGVLYPALSQLEQAGLARVELSGKRKNYHLTDAGAAHLHQHNEQARTLMAVLKHAAKKMMWMAQATDNEQGAMAATGWLPEYVEARKALQTALLASSDASHDEQRRISQILLQAANAIQHDSAQ